MPTPGFEHGWLWSSTLLLDHGGAPHYYCKYTHTCTFNNASNFGTKLHNYGFKLFIGDKVLVIIHEKDVTSSNLLINHYVNMFSYRFLQTNYVILNWALQIFALHTLAI